MAFFCYSGTIPGMKSFLLAALSCLSMVGCATNRPPEIPPQVFRPKPTPVNLVTLNQSIQDIDKALGQANSRVARIHILIDAIPEDKK